MTFEFNFVLVGLMQIVGFFVQGCTGFGCMVYWERQKVFRTEH